MWHNRMPRLVRLSLATGVLVLAGAPAATATPTDTADEVTTAATTTAETTTATAVAPPTTTTAVESTTVEPTTVEPTTVAPTTTPDRYVPRNESEEETSSPSTTTTASVTSTTITVPPEPSVPTTEAVAPSSGPGEFAAASRSGLSVSVAGPLGTIVPGATSASGTLTLITVRDESSGPRGWVATASSTDFVGPNGTIPKSAVTYRATALAGELLGGDLTSKGSQSLESPKVVVERTGLDWPLEIITWTPALTVDYPGGAAVGTYKGTITISVA